jgi:hypothetical protein
MRVTLALARRKISPRPMKSILPTPTGLSTRLAKIACKCCSLLSTWVYKGTDEGWIEELMKLEPEKCLAYPENSAVDQYSDGKWLNINSTYTYEIVHRKLLADYNRPTTMPFFLIESSYEGEHNSSEVQIRRQAYWSVLCGGVGHVMGNNPIWHFDRPWQYPTKLNWEQSLDLPGSVGMMY